MFPPDKVRVEFVVWLDAEMQDLTYGWTICDGAEMQLVEMEARPRRDLASDLSEVGNMLTDRLEVARARLAPFH